MNCEEKRVLGIHARDEHLFLEDDMIAVAWHEMGDLARIEPTREAFRAAYAAAHPAAGRSSVSSSAGMLYRFVHEMQPGDYVVFPSRMDRQVNIGVVDGAYAYAANARHYAQRRKVRWLRHLPRTSFTQGALYELGACMSLFSVKNYADEFLQALDGDRILAPDEPEPAGAAAENIIESTKDYVLKELSRRFKGYELEELVAELLRAIGYRATVSPRGGDSGIDLILKYYGGLSEKLRHMIPLKPAYIPADIDYL